MRVREELPHGEWIPWVEANCEFSRRTATNYIQCAERAMLAYYNQTGAPLPVPDSGAGKALKQRILDILEDDSLTEERAALIAAVRPKPVKPELPPAPEPKPAKQRGPRGPVVLSEKAVPKVAERLKTAPPPVRWALFSALREEIREWMDSMDNVDAMDAGGAA